MRMMEKPIWWEYAEYYPDEDEAGYDGVHDGGVKGISPDAPEEVRKAYTEYVRQAAENKKHGIKV